MMAFNCIAERLCRYSVAVLETPLTEALSPLLPSLRRSDHQAVIRDSTDSRPRRERRSVTAHARLRESLRRGSHRVIELETGIVMSSSSALRLGCLRLERRCRHLSSSGLHQACSGVQSSDPSRAFMKPCAGM